MDWDGIPTVHVRDGCGDGHGRRAGVGAMPRANITERLSLLLSMTQEMLAVILELRAQCFCPQCEVAGLNRWSKAPRVRGKICAAVEV